MSVKSSDGQANEHDSANAAGEMMLVPVEGFPDVPLEVVHASGWKDVASGRRRYRNENIMCLGRGVEIFASTQQLYQKKVRSAF